jgi:hypothetical protein
MPTTDYHHQRPLPLLPKFILIQDLLSISGSQFPIKMKTSKKKIRNKLKTNVPTLFQLNSLLVSRKVPVSCDQVLPQTKKHLQMGPSLFVRSLIHPPLPLLGCLPFFAFVSISSISMFFAVKMLCASRDGVWYTYLLSSRGQAPSPRLQTRRDSSRHLGATPPPPPPPIYAAGLAWPVGLLSAERHRPGPSPKAVTSRMSTFRTRECCVICSLGCFC